MSVFFRDLQYAARTLLKARSAAGIAILALALGLGVNVSAFIAVNGIILHPLPFPNLDRVVTIWENNPKVRLDRTASAAANFLDLQTQARSFQYLAACRSLLATVRNGTDSETVRLAQISPAFFDVLSAKAALGRIPRSEARSLVISDSFWKTRLASSPDAVGRVLHLAQGAFTIAAVMPDNFDYPLGTEVWSPLLLTPADGQQRSVHNLSLLGLLRPGVLASQANSEAAAIAARLASEHPATNRDRSFDVIPLREFSEGVTNRFLSVILSTAGFVLLLACANIGNLQLARAAGRRKEIAVRAALGASRFQIARHLLAESLLLSIAAGFLGVLLADWNNVYSKQNIPAIAMRIVPGLRTMRLDPTVLVFAFLVSILAGVLCGLPAIFELSRRATRLSLIDSLKERISGSSQQSSGIFRSALVVSELALALVLLIGAGLMVQTFDRLLALNQGFDPKNLITAQVSLPLPEYTEPASRLAYYDRVLAALLQIPGIGSSAISSNQGPPRHFAIEGRPDLRPGEPLPSVVAVSPLYLELLRIPLLQGRGISSADHSSTSLTVVLSKTFAHYYWPDASPIGHRIKFTDSEDWLTVVGVSADVISDWFNGKPSNRAYVSYAQLVPSSAEVVARTSGDPVALIPAVRTQLQLLAPTVPLFDFKTMQQAMADERSGVHAAATTMTSYAIIALLLAVTGIYAVVSYLVSMRTHDIGVHIALGATRLSVLKMMMRQTGALIFLGLGCGIALSLVLTRIMAHVLFDVVQLNPQVWIGLTAILLAAALLAAYLPALRATRIDPIAALRNE
jgi:putative ABC transport system permease protein